MTLDALNPFRQVAIPALFASVVGVVSLVGGHYLWPLGIVPGVSFCVIGARIAYGHSGAASYLRAREAVPWWGASGRRAA
jgi:hypothetical protein